MSPGAQHVTPDGTQDAARAAEQAARRGYGKLVAYLSARTRDVAAAEDALSAAFEAALLDWPRSGVPTHPEAWLLTAARRSLIDAQRRRRTRDSAVPDLLLLADTVTDDAQRHPVPDDRLRLMFACAHPAIDRGVHAPLMLQTILGFDAASIASAFLVAPSAMGQRLVRAKAKIKQAGIPFRLPDADDLPSRLDAVLAAIYAAYAEGWSDGAGTDPRRRNLAEEGIWLGELVASLMPDAAEALGLLALMLHAQARRQARSDAAGDYVPLDAQDPRRWDVALIDRAEALLHRASTFATIGRYQLEAAVQSAHAVRRLGRPTDWPAIVQLYDALAALTGSPVVLLNRAVAMSEAGAPQDALEEVMRLNGDPRLASYQPYWAARAQLLARAGQAGDAAHAYRRAIGLAADPAIRRFLQSRLDALPGALR